MGSTVPRIETRWPIKRVIYVMLENRSFNNLFGKFPGVRGTTTGVENGVEKPLIRCPEWLPGDLPHDLAAHRLCVNGGAMDGFGTGLYGSTYAYTIFDEEQIPNYWYWAREYSPVRELLLVGGGTELSQPLLLHRRQLRRRLRQPGEHPQPQGGRKDVQELGM